jgi:hypothetical protein
MWSWIALLLVLSGRVAPILASPSQLNGLLSGIVEPDVGIDTKAALDAATVDGQPEGPALGPLVGDDEAQARSILVETRFLDLSACPEES